MRVSPKKLKFAEVPMNFSFCHAGNADLGSVQQRQRILYPLNFNLIQSSYLEGGTLVRFLNLLFVTRWNPAHGGAKKLNG